MLGTYITRENNILNITVNKDCKQNEVLIEEIVKYTNHIKTRAADFVAAEGAEDYIKRFYGALRPFNATSYEEHFENRDAARKEEERNRMAQFLFGKPECKSFNIDR